MKTNIGHYELFRSMLKNNVTRYDVTPMYAGFAERGGGGGEIQMVVQEKGSPILKEIFTNKYNY